jgi:hypothetical protein
MMFHGPPTRDEWELDRALPTPRSCVYVIEDRAAALVKVGTSGAPVARLAQIRKQHPRAWLYCFVAVHDAPAVELFVHTILRARHEHGEWYRVRPVTALRAVRFVDAFLSLGEFSEHHRFVFSEIVYRCKQRRPPSSFRPMTSSS